MQNHWICNGRWNKNINKEISYDIFPRYFIYKHKYITGSDVTTQNVLFSWVQKFIDFWSTSVRDFAIM